MPTGIIAEATGGLPSSPSPAKHGCLEAAEVLPFLLRTEERRASPGTICTKHDPERTSPGAGARGWELPTSGPSIPRDWTDDPAARSPRSLVGLSGHAHLQTWQPGHVPASTVQDPAGGRPNPLAAFWGDVSYNHHTFPSWEPNGGVAIKTRMPPANPPVG